MGDSRAQGRHAGLTRDQLLEAAVRLVDRQGAASLSMRKLARELGVEAMTLYHHVQNKQALEDAIVERVITESLRPPRTGASWQEVLADYADGLLRGLTAHPGAVPLFVARPALTTRNVAELEKLLHVLRDAGFSPRTALLMVHTVASSVIGQHLARPTDEREILDQLAQSPAEEFPVFAQALEAGPLTIDTRLGFTVSALIAGFEPHRTSNEASSQRLR